MTFEVVAASIHVVDHTEVDTRALYMEPEAQSLGFQER